MTQTKFTPAPWVVKLEAEDEAIEIAMSSYLETPNSYYSCHKVLIEADDEEAIANANLIAAAPEMYAFIESLQLDVERDMQRDELLAKARGEK